MRFILSRARQKIDPIYIYSVAAHVVFSSTRAPNHSLPPRARSCASAAPLQIRRCHASSVARTANRLHWVPWRPLSPLRHLGGRARRRRVWLGTFNRLEEAARAYNTACWRFSHGREWLNFPDAKSWEKVEFLAQPPNL
jgi:hypothetical protein